MAGLVSVDETGFSVSFNEYLRLVSLQRRAEPDEHSLLDVFLSFDPHQTGKIDEKQFRRIMRSKEAIPEEDVEEMLTEYKRIQRVEEGETKTGVIYYKEFISMLQQ
ncbi:uncharacterized protein LOC111712037 [Eurytemora carolleeae]|uniref:uncharacterized protein LOC111712037 n=1 Tax=Eurytemora carolleeae TaxID=1294199 RepID=UPI000C7946D3|nr:uncharacterized protein LOC111712037 [Eurytemora carolleeae]|eukprot:XP_023342314.1 uncharacterized protein LOC111712037 [Eurytemora affinis]